MNQTFNLRFLCKKSKTIIQADGYILITALRHCSFYSFLLLIISACQTVFHFYIRMF